MKNYKSPLNRLVHLFEKGRDVWKKRATEKQKRIKALEIKVRDLSISRENWKHRAKEAEKKLNQAEKKLSAPETLISKPSITTNGDNNAVRIGEVIKAGQVSKMIPTMFHNSGNQSSCDSRVGDFIPIEACATQVPARHQHPVFVIQLALEQFLKSLNSFRGCLRYFEVFAQFFSLPTPSFSSIRNWLLRAGLYELQKKPEKRNDWIFIADMTIKLGTAKCLVILGITKATLKEVMARPGFKGLTHKDVEVLSVEILFQSNGEIIEQCLNELSQKIGVPIQIIADHGSDLSKGIRLFILKNPNVIDTHDVTHYMALKLEKELESDERYQSFLKHCSETRTNVQQTPLNALMPPPQRPKSRYLNVESLVPWAKQFPDLEECSPFFRLESNKFKELEPKLDDTTGTKLKALVNKTYSSKQSFSEALSLCLEPHSFEKYQEIIYSASSVEPERLVEKFGWLEEYRPDIMVYSRMLDIVHLAERQLKRHGLNQESKARFLENTKHQQLTPRLQKFKDSVSDYFCFEGAKIPIAETLYPSSDILESIFGKYKIFSGESPIPEVSELVLTIPLCTINITSSFVKQAMENVSIRDVDIWVNQAFGGSTLSRKKAIFGTR